MQKLRGSLLKAFLDEKVEQYNQPGFLTHDPVQIPHAYRKKQDIEIAGFFAAILAWGQRKTIINKTRELLLLMEDKPHDFLLHHTESDLKRFKHFKHRTFNGVDAIYFVKTLTRHYRQYDSLEVAFSPPMPAVTMRDRLIYFHEYFFQQDPGRTVKHIATPARKSACKRLNMFLRWMVRADQKGVDFGIWSGIAPAELVCPCDLHVDRVARKLGLLSRKILDWEAAMELTDNLRNFDALDPVKYDFALFGLGVEEQF